MPRLSRLNAPGVLHHVMGRGIERRKIFRSDRDRNDFIDRLSALVQEDSMEIYAWVLMPNHFHILCKTKNLPLSISMRRILTGYVVNFNKRHRRYGHLFQNRYKSIVCQEDVYLKELVRYIHLNLLRAGLVKDLKVLNRNPWSGHSALAGKVKREWQNTKYVLSFFGSSNNSRKNYLRKDAVILIDKEMVNKWAKDLIFTKTFVGLCFQESILKKVAERKNEKYRLATPAEESTGIDGFIGKKPISI